LSINAVEESMTTIDDATKNRRKKRPKPAIRGDQGIGLDDFWAFMPTHKYIFSPTRELWPGASINARLPPVRLVDAAGDPVCDQTTGEPIKLRATTWLDREKPIEQMFWAPGLPEIIPDVLLDQGGWIKRRGVNCFNLYRPAPAVSGEPARAVRWLRHLRRVYPNDGDADHICNWFAHRVQRPEEKINHALVLGGPQGIGKDTLIEPVKRAVGAWNCAEVQPRTIVEAAFNGFLRSTLLRINEARDLGEVNRYAFYETMKGYIASPPDVLRINEKNLREYYVLNCCGVVITTNYKVDGIYLPADDRRHYVAWSPLAKEDFSISYWHDMWSWYENGGAGDIAAYLARLDLAGFDAKAPPPKTPAFWDIVSANHAPENIELSDLLEQLDNPQTLTLKQLVDKTRNVSGFPSEFGEWLSARKNRRLVPHRLEACGYVSVRNPEAKDGIWKVNGHRQVVYAKTALCYRDQVAAVRRWIG
jgi:hypothetical protein